MIRRTLRRPPARRGAILLVVLGMLALFAVVGLSFVLYAESEATGARNNRAARSEVADPDPAAVANQFLAQLIFDTADQTSALYAHSFARSRFGPAGTQSPFTGTGIPTEALTLNGLDSGGAAVPGIALDRTQAVNFRNLVGWQPVSPDFRSDGTTPISKAVPWTYPDRNNYFLAYYDPYTDQVTVPSFHRPDLFLNTNPAYPALADQIAQSLNPNNPLWRNNGDPSGGDSSGYWKTLRPRQAEHPAFPTVPANADGTYTGDVSNLKFLGGSQKNDSLWMDPSLPVKEWRGKRYKPLVAALVLDLSGRLNLAVAGNGRAASVTPAAPHGSHHGWGVWEVNPTPLANPTAFLAGGGADLTALLNLRYTGANPAAATPPSLDRFRNLSTGTLNGGRMTTQYSRIDASGTGTGAADPLTTPAAGGFAPFPTYSNRFAASQSTVAVPPTLDSQLGVLPSTYHAQTFGPGQWPRQPGPAANTPWVPSLEDQMRTDVRFGGPKGNTALANQATPINLNRQLTTLFSVSQRWGEVPVRVNNVPTAFARVAAIDITRPLPDYRQNLNGPVSPQNIGNLVNARVARQNLARDIFVRLVAAANLIDGTNVAYNPTTGYLQSFDVATSTYTSFTAAAPLAQLQVWAQYAANMVDQIDGDDVSTAFVWNPADATQYDVNDTVTGGMANPNLPNIAAAQIGVRTVFGTELPKLVLNEAFNALDNDRTEKPPALDLITMKQPAKKNVRKQYWIELHNPLPADPVLPEGGAARLRYDPAITPVFDAATNMLQMYSATATPNPVYQIEVAEVAAGMMGVPQQPYSAALVNPLAVVPTIVANHATTPVPGMTHKIILNDYTAWNPAATPDMPMALPANDALNVVPATGGTGAASYALIGPRDQFPAPAMAPVANTLNVPDLPAAPPPGPVNSLTYDAGAPSAANLSTQGGTSSVILLRRLVNPFLPAQPDPTIQTTPYNPYMTVDYLEYVPVRDRVEYDDTDKRAGYPFPTTNAPTVGRKHPYAAAPCYLTPLPAVPAVADQVDAAIIMNPPHSFLKANSNLDNATGLAWLAHLDREPVNALELLPTSAVSPAQLTQKFYDGSNVSGLYQKHLSPLPIPAGTQAFPPLVDAANYPTAFRALDLLAVPSRLPGGPVGGRTAGMVNVNTAAHEAILQAVLDPQSGNRFNAAYVTAAWNNGGVGVLPSRTTYPAAPAVPANNLPTATAGELTAAGAPGTDRPFQPGGLLLQDTLLRGPAGATTPLTSFLVNAAGGNHPALLQEPAQKGWNSLTTVSDGFLVAFTVGFFEVDSANRLGKELYDKVPGDLRAQYAGVVDRTALTVDPAPIPALPAGQFALGPKPWETKLTGDAPRTATSLTIQATPGPAANQFTVYDDGNPVVITAPAPAVPQLADTGPLLYVGYAGLNAGGDGEWVRVDTFTPGPAGSGTVTVAINTTPSAVATNVQYSTTLQRFHGGGTRVSNAAVGHPGPQPAFDFREPTGRYRGVLPFFMRLTP